MGIKREVRTGVRKMIFESRAFTTLIGVMIPFLGTTLGASMVFFMKNEFKINLQRFLLGFASGVMIAASVWSLLIPAIDQSASYGKAAWVPAAVGFLVGITFFLLLDKITPYLRAKAKQAEGITKRIRRESMLFLAVPKEQRFPPLLQWLFRLGFLFKTFQKEQLYQCQLKRKRDRKDRHFGMDLLLV